MKKFCDNCNREVETKIITKLETYKVYGEDIDVDAKVLVCENCGEEFYCENLDNAMLVSVYNEYRRRHKLLLPDEIKKIREQYGLSQRSFAKLLNWGDKTIFRYENGSLQDKAHNSLLLFLRDPENMRTYISENEIALPPKQLNKLIKTVDTLESHDGHVKVRKYFDIIFAGTPSEENGYKEFNYDKFCSMVLFFANKNRELLKTKLMKLLHYSDMIFYKENGVSISGSRYVHLPYGPVPDKFDILLGEMEEDHLAHIEISCDNGDEKHEVVPDEELRTGILSDRELDVLERIYKRFMDFGSVDISNYSHKEKGYIDTKRGEIISYDYAKYIDLD